MQSFEPALRSRSLLASMSVVVTLLGCGPDTSEGFTDTHGTHWRYVGKTQSTQHRDALTTLDPVSGEVRGPVQEEAGGEQAMVPGAVADLGDGREYVAEPTELRRRTPELRVEEGKKPSVAQDTQAVVRGSDDRVSRNQASNPYKMITQYLIPQTGGLALGCTATLIGSHWAATAAHCVYSRDDDAWIYGTTPQATLDSLGLQKDRGYVRINGTVSWVVARWHAAGYGTTTFIERELDYALLELQTDLGTTQGSMRLSSITDEATLQDLYHYNAGYPSEVDGNAVTGQWGMHCNVLNSTSDGRLTYDCDTSKGHSGGPVYYYNTTYSAYYMTAIHSGANATHNTGPRVGGTVHEWFDSKM